MPIQVCRAAAKNVMSNTAKKATVAVELVNTVSTMTVVKDAKGSNGNGKVEDALAEVIPEVK